MLPLNHLCWFLKESFPCKSNGWESGVLKDQCRSTLPSSTWGDLQSLVMWSKLTWSFLQLVQCWSSFAKPPKLKAAAVTCGPLGQARNYTHQ